MTLFDQGNLAEINPPNYPGERLIACRNPSGGSNPAATAALAAERARKRLALLEAADVDLAKIVDAVAAGRLTGAGRIGIRVGEVIGRHKMSKHYILTITDTEFAFTRDTNHINAEAALDGIYPRRHHRPRADEPRQRSWPPTSPCPG